MATLQKVAKKVKGMMASLGRRTGGGVEKKKREEEEEGKDDEQQQHAFDCDGGPS